MGIYFSIFLLFGIFILSKSYFNDAQLVNVTSYKALNFLVISLAFIFLFCIYYFRGQTVGTDYPMYNNFYYSSNEYLKSIGIEPGYLFLYGLARRIGNFRVVSGFSFLVLWCGIIRFARQLKIDRLTVISFFVVSYTYLDSFNTVRQMTAVGIVLIGLGAFLSVIEDFREKRISKFHLAFAFFRYLIYVIIAQQFHSSAWLAILVPLIMTFKVSPWKIIVGGVLTVVAYISGIANIIFPHFLFLFSHYVEKYAYDGTSFFIEGKKSLIALLPIIIQFIFLYIIVKYEEKFVQANRSLLNGYYVYLILFFGGGNTPILRMQEYFLFFIVFFYAKYFTYRRDSSIFENLIWFKFLVLSFWILYAVISVVRNISGINPYVFQI